MGKTPKRITAENVRTLAGEVAVKQQSKEEAELPFQCDICQKRFKSKSGMLGHMSTHNVETVLSANEDEDQGINKEDPTEWIRRYVKGVVVNEDLIKALSTQEQVTFIIPEDPFDTKISYLFGLNGQFFEYPIGQYIVLPRDIVTQIRSQYKESEIAKRRNLMDRSKDVTTALTR